MMFFGKNKKKEAEKKAAKVAARPTANPAELEALASILHDATLDIVRSFITQYEQIIVTHAQEIPDYAANRDKLLEADGNYTLAFFGGLILFNAEVYELFPAMERAGVIDKYADVLNRQLAYRSPSAGDPSTKPAKVEALSMFRNQCERLFLGAGATESDKEVGDRLMAFSMTSIRKIYPSILDIVWTPGGLGLTSPLWVEVMMCFNRHVAAGGKFIEQRLSPSGEA